MAILDAAEEKNEELPQRVARLEAELNALASLTISFAIELVRSDKIIANLSGVSERLRESGGIDEQEDGRIAADAARTLIHTTRSIAERAPGGKRLLDALVQSLETAASSDEGETPQ